jgi:formylglycine-generating enzyme required for sulfatase activity/predicted Ser/Thr protein kinase
MSLQPGTKLFDRYRIVKALNQGGFGAIYHAWDTALGRPCALKENLDTSEEARRQFEREAKILANLSHPNLPRVTDYFFVPAQGQYLVMDFVEGQDLQNKLEQHGMPLPEVQVLTWIEQVCDALEYLHAQTPPIIHRDVKPANIQITPDGRVVLVDFGIAKLYDPGLKTTHGARAVTPGFSPHEQYGQDTTDARSDIYALGATLYTLLTAQEPPESIQRVVRDPLIPAEQLNPALSASTLAALERALRLDPEKRFQRAADFKTALRSSAVSLQRSAQPLRSSQPASTSHHASTRPIMPWAWVSVIVALMVMLVVLALVAQAGRRALQEPMASQAVLATSVNPVSATPPLMASVTPTYQVRSVPVAYIVQPGDTCGMIAQKYGLPVSDLIAFNHLSIECAIFAGSRLLIPAASATVTPISPAPVPVRVGPVDGMEMVLVPAGVFWRGAEDNDLDAGGDETPGHWVYLDEFWLDRTEVTNGMYALCVQAGVCQAPTKRGSKTRLLYYGDSSYDDYPVIHVSWQDANTYCNWVGRRLPTEAQWEKAARGGDGRAYPWGEQNPSARLVNFNNQVGDTTPAGNYPQGASPYGALDLAGNVQEWVADWYNANYYRLAPIESPLGPDSGEFRVLRGGSWFSAARAVRATFRNWNYADQGNDSSGFRCAQ